MKLKYIEDAYDAAIDIEGLIVYQLQEKYDVEVDVNSKEWQGAYEGMLRFIEGKIGETK